MKKDELINELQERFTGHEVEVDPGLWEAISGKLAASGADGLQDLLRDKFTGHEVPVDPHVWTNISTQLGHGAAAGGGAAAWLAGGLAAAAVVGGLAWWLATGEQPVTTDVKTATEQVAIVPAPVVPTGTDAAPAARTAGAEARSAGTRADEGPRTAADGSATARTDHISTNPAAPTDVAASEGERTVNEVLGNLMQENTTEPHFPDAPEPVPAPPADVAIPTFTPEQMANSPIETRITTERAPELAEDADEADEVAEEQNPAGTALEPRIYIPNVFSPQGDGVNDKLKVVGDHYQRVSVRIISARTDALVFRSNNLDDQWNGRDLNNVPCEEGYYFYAIEVTGLDGVTYSKGEVIRLFR